mmetsp:Transcript_23775/g.58831  ORF Transcript_23775/g.58831 Transcript_23775/m.58831 type:complete len:220 (-) Transcript_23775:196-855(-)
MQASNSPVRPACCRIICRRTSAFSPRSFILPDASSRGSSLHPDHGTNPRIAGLLLLCSRIRSPHARCFLMPCCRRLRIFQSQSTVVVAASTSAVAATALWLSASLPGAAAHIAFVSSLPTASSAASSVRGVAAAADSSVSLSLSSSPSAMSSPVLPSTNASSSFPAGSLFSTLAVSNGVSLALFCTLIGAPALKSTRSTPRAPKAAARCMAVCPHSSSA